MLSELLATLFETVGSFFVMLLIARAVMRWMRISFVSQIGQFILTLTNWLIVPMQRVLPSVGRLDLACLVPAWLIESLIVLLVAWLRQGHPGLSPTPLFAALTIGAFELLRSALYLLLGVVIVGAVLSWVNPYSPLRGTLDMFSRPFLDPIRRRLPLVSGIDLSPLVLWLILTVLFRVLDVLHTNFSPLLYR